MTQNVIITTPDDKTVLSNWFAEEIANELADPTYANRTHGTRSCVNAGCKGPLCSKYHRDRMREIYRKKHPDQKAQRPGPEDPERDAFLAEIIAAHIESRKQVA